MNMIAKTSLIALLAASLAGCSGGKPDESATGPAAPTTTAPPNIPATTAAADAAPPAFGICKSCHAVEKGKTLIGPSLAGVAGAKAGDMPGYAASPALKAANLTWDDATLDKWLESPMTLVPGTRMSYAGQVDPVKRKAIIAYLKTLK